jgi:hypothetical protein
MGKGKRRYHEIPKYYLRGFCEPDTSFLWTFERDKPFSPGNKGRANNPHRSGVGVTALRPDQYRALKRDGLVHFEYERRLGKQEHQADEVIRKLRAFESIDDSEKYNLSEYILLMNKRRTSRDKALQPLVQKRIAVGYQAVRRLVDDAQFSKALKLQKELGYLGSDDGKTEYLRESMVRNVGLVIKEIAGMRWQFIKASLKDYFVTTDNPVVFDRNLGLVRSELIFPLSSDVTLFADRSDGKDLAYRDSSPNETRRLNSMIIMSADREIYSPRADEWIHKGWTRGFAFIGNEDGTTA